MPQTTKKVSPEYAKSYYGFVIDNTLPGTSGIQSQNITVNRFTTGNGEVMDYLQDDPVVEQPPPSPEKNGSDLF